MSMMRFSSSAGMIFCRFWSASALQMAGNDVTLTAIGNLPSDSILSIQTLSQAPLRAEYVYAKHAQALSRLKPKQSGILVPVG
jgi:hypothetical protein